jgi:hypothetical protein
METTGWPCRRDSLAAATQLSGRQGAGIETGLRVARVRTEGLDVGNRRPDGGRGPPPRQLRQPRQTSWSRVAEATSMTWLPLALTLAADSGRLPLVGARHGGRGAPVVVHRHPGVVDGPNQQAGPIVRGRQRRATIPPVSFLIRWSPPRTSATGVGRVLMGWVCRASRGCWLLRLSRRTGRLRAVVGISRMRP